MFFRYFSATFNVKETNSSENTYMLNTWCYFFFHRINLFLSGEEGLSYHLFLYLYLNIYVEVLLSPLANLTYQCACIMPLFLLKFINRDSSQLIFFSFKITILSMEHRICSSALPFSYNIYPISLSKISTFTKKCA